MTVTTGVTEEGGTLKVSIATHSTGNHDHAITMDENEATKLIEAGAYSIIKQAREAGKLKRKVEIKWLGELLRLG